MNRQFNNSDCLEAFNRYVAECKPTIREQYITLLAHDLSRQQWQGCFQRNALIVLEQMYDGAFVKLQSLPFDASQCQFNKEGMSDLTRQVLSAFQGFSDDFLLFVVDKHRTSCALSNFPDEHKPDHVYVNEVKRAIATLWKNFALSVNDHFLR